MSDEPYRNLIPVKYETVQNVSGVVQRSITGAFVRDTDLIENGGECSIDSEGFVVGPPGLVVPPDKPPHPPHPSKP